MPSLRAVCAIARERARDLRHLHFVAVYPPTELEREIIRTEKEY
jgi:hypothetical protein